MTIKKYSSSLLGLLTRNFSHEMLPMFETAFSLAIKHGGLEELDYKRPEGQSYNPAPARIAQIAINDAELRDASAIVVSLLIFVNKSLSHEEVATKFNEQIAVLYNSSCKSPQHLLQEENTVAKILASCAWLDRLRHLHLAPESTRSALLKMALTQTEVYLQLVRGHSDPLVVLLEAWKTRASNKQN